MAAVLLLACARGGRAQTPAAAPSSAASASPSAAPSPTPIPLEMLATQTASVSKTLQEINDDLASDTLDDEVAGGLPPLVVSIDAQTAKDERVVAHFPVLDTLRALMDEVNVLRSPLDQWQNLLTRRLSVLDHYVVRLSTMQAAWTDALRRGQASPDTPPALLDQVRATVASVGQAREQVEKYKTRLLSLQTQVAEQDVRLSQADLLLQKTREAAANRLFVRDSPPLWSRRVWTGQDLTAQFQEALFTQRDAFAAYCAAHVEAFLLLLVSVLAVTGFVMWVGVRVRPWAAEDPALALLARVFERPVASAVLLSVMLTPFLFVEPPRMLVIVMTGVVLVPAVMVLSRVVPSSLHVVLRSLLVLLVMDVARVATASYPHLQRVVMVAEATCAGAFLAWLLMSNRTRTGDQATDAQWAVLGDPRHKLALLRIFARTAVGGLVVSALAATAGYTVLGRLSLNLVAVSTYLGTVLYAIVLVVDGLMVLFLRIRPLSSLGLVSNHLMEAQTRVHGWLIYLAGVAWVLLTVDLVVSRQTLADRLAVVVGYQLTVGTLQVAVGSVLAFAVTVWLSFVVSRVLRCILVEDVYPRVEMERGVPYAVSSIVHYSVLLIGFLVALAALGVEMTKFTILMSAFGVGLGFGLQTMVNNFISGVILLFERPVKVGDLLDVKGFSGEMKAIGLRASVLRTYDGSEVVVPNGTLLSNEVTNWTLSDLQRRLKIQVGVAYGTDPERVMALLCEVGRAHPDVLADPAPTAFFMGFGDSALNFELRAWTAECQSWLRVLSDLNVGVNRALNEADIEIPFPQRDVHMR